MTIDLKLSKREQALMDRNYAIERLLTHYVKPGTKVYTIMRHVSSSGMSRNISLVIANGEEVIDITYYAAHALGWRLVERNGQRAIRVQGGGMDMRFHLVSTLSAVLFHGQYRAEYALDYELA